MTLIRAELGSDRCWVICSLLENLYWWTFGEEDVSGILIIDDALLGVLRKTTNYRLQGNGRSCRDPFHRTVSLRGHSTSDSTPHNL